MAITILKQASNPSPVHNPIPFRVSSSESAQENFSIIAKVEVDGDILASYRLPIGPEGYCQFDIHKPLQGAVGLSYPSTQHNLLYARASGGFTPYSITFFEEYRVIYDYSEVFNSLGKAVFTTQQAPSFEAGDSIEVLTSSTTNYIQQANVTLVVENFPDYYIYTDLTYVEDATGTLALANYELSQFESTTTIENFYTWDSAFTISEYQNAIINNTGAVTFNDYFGDGSFGKKFSTSIPQDSVFEVDQNAMIGFNIVYDKSLYSTLYAYTEFDSHPTGGVKLTISPTMDSLVNAGPVHLNAPTTTPYPQVGETCTFSVVDSSDNVVFGPFNYLVTESCSKYETINLLFKDQKGSYVPFTFDLVNRNNFNISKSTYKQDRDFMYSADTKQTNRLASFKRGKTTFSVRVDESYIITSKWLNQASSDLLIDLFKSPDVYWFKSPTGSPSYGELVPINILDSQVERKQTINDLLVNYTLTFELANRNQNIK